MKIAFSILMIIVSISAFSEATSKGNSKGKGSGAGWRESYGENVDKYVLDTVNGSMHLHFQQLDCAKIAKSTKRLRFDVAQVNYSKVENEFSITMLYDVGHCQNGDWISGHEDSKDIGHYTNVSFKLENPNMQGRFVGIVGAEYSLENEQKAILIGLNASQIRNMLKETPDGIILKMTVNNGNDVNIDLLIKLKLDRENNFFLFFE